MIEQIAKQLFDDLNKASNKFSDAQDEASSLIKELIQAQLKKLNLVSREEFDAQTSVLHRTRDKLAELEAKIAEYEAGVEE